MTFLNNPYTYATIIVTTIMLCRVSYVRMQIEKIKGNSIAIIFITFYLSSIVFIVQLSLLLRWIFN